MQIELVSVHFELKFILNSNIFLFILREKVTLIKWSHFHYLILKREINWH